MVLDCLYRHLWDLYDEDPAVDPGGTGTKVVPGMSLAQRHISGPPTPGATPSRVRAWHHEACTMDPHAPPGTRVEEGAGLHHKVAYGVSA